jgi:hypothetical protein
MLRVAAHELTHFIEQWNAKAYKRLRDLLLDYYYSKDYDTVRGLVQEQMDLAEANGQHLTEEEAMDEVIASACEMMLSDAEAIRAVAEGNKKLGAKIKGWIERVIAKIESALKGLAPHSRAAKLLAGSRETLEKAREMWIAALDEIAETDAENAQSLIGADAQTVYAAATPVQNELNALLKEISEALGFATPYSPVRQKSVSSMENKVNRKKAEGRAYTLLDMKDHARSCLIMDSFEQAADVLAMLDARGIPYAVEAVGPTDYGYRGLHVTWRTEKGLGVEVQLTTPEAWKTKLASDEIYDKWRNADAAALSAAERSEYIKDRARSIEMWNQLGLPNLSIYERASSAEMTLESITSDMGSDRTILPQRPSENSSYQVDPSKRSNRPDSVTEYVNPSMKTPLSDNHIIQQTGTGVNAATVYDGANNALQVHYALADADALITSNLDDSMAENPAYPQALQPRDRTRSASMQQIDEIAKHLNPARLGASATVQDGAPIIGSDNVVESGNGRVLAIRAAMQRRMGTAKQYTQWLRENAQTFGLQASDVKENSVLVRVRDTEVNRADFVKRANESTTAMYSPAETARSDAEKMSGELLRRFVPNERGEIDTAANRSFFTHFLDEVVPANERGASMKENGRLSQAGITRVRNALFQRAYGSTRLTQEMSETTDSSCRNVIRALTNVAARVAAIDQDIRDGYLNDRNLAPELAQAADRYIMLKDTGVDIIEEYFAQYRMPGMDMETPTAGMLMRMFDRNKRSTIKMTNAINAVLDRIESYGDPQQTSLLGEGSVPTLAEIAEPILGRNDFNEDMIVQREVQYSNRVNTNDIITGIGIEQGMSDWERADALDGAEIETVNAAVGTDALQESDIRYVNSLARSKAETYMRTMARRLGLISGEGTEAATLENDYLTITATFSNQGLHESVVKQKSSLGNLAALLPVLKETYRTAVPVLVQGDRYRYAVSDDSNVNAFVYLLGAFKYGETLVPVQFEVKMLNGDGNRLYVVATIKDDALNTAPPAKYANSTATTSSTVSVQEIVRNVKADETRILANLPSYMLTEEQREGKREGLRNKGMYVKSKAEAAGRNTSAPVKLTQERIDSAIKYYGGSGDYSKAYMAMISPSDFLSLTTTNADMIRTDSRAMVAEEMRETDTPFLQYDPETNEITGHEGRHRMAAMETSRVQETPVLLIPDGSKGRYNRQALDSLTVTGQTFGTGTAQGRVTVKSLIPVNEKHRAELEANFGEGETWFRYSNRDGTQSNRQLLAQAFESVVQNDADRRRLREYQSRIAELDTKTAELKALEAELSDLSQVDWTEEETRENRQRAQTLRREIVDADAVLLRMEGTEDLQRVAGDIRRTREQEIERNARAMARESVRRYREGVERRELAGTIKRRSERLAKWITEPSSKGSVPKALQSSIASFLLGIEQSQNAEFTGKDGRRREQRFRESMGQLVRVVSDLQEYQQADAADRVAEDFGGYLDLPRDFTVQMAQVVDRMEQALSESNGRSVVDNMDIESLRRLNEMLLTISNSVRQANELLTVKGFQHVGDAAKATISDIRRQGKVRDVEKCG